MRNTFFQKGEKSGRQDTIVSHQKELHRPEFKNLKKTLKINPSLSCLKKAVKYIRDVSKTVIRKT